MASKTQQKETQTEKRGRGRPPAGEGRSPEVIAVGNLQDTANRACAIVNDHPNVSVAARIARCARAGVPRQTVDRALAGLKEALGDLEDATERAYAAPTARAPIAQRVNLLE